MSLTCPVDQILMNKKRAAIGAGNRGGCKGCRSRK